MVSSLLHLLVRHVLWNKKSPLPKLGGNIRHCLCRLLEILELPSKLLHLNNRCELNPEPSRKITLGHRMQYCVITNGSPNLLSLLSSTSSKSFKEHKITLKMARIAQEHLWRIRVSILGFGGDGGWDGGQI